MKEESANRVWRIHLKPSGGKGIPEESVRLCLEQSVIGMGWGLDEKPASKYEYMCLGKERYGHQEGWWKNAEALLFSMRQDDLVWFKDTEGTYYLARVTDDWEYRDGQENLDADIINVRPVEIHKVGPKIFPSVKSYFSPPLTIMGFSNEHAILLSRALYNKLSGKHFYSDAVSLSELPVSVLKEWVDFVGDLGLST